MLSGYDMIASENCWSFSVWQAGVISKVAAFLWLALKAKVLTCDRLTRRGIRVLSCCYLCGKEDERLDHLLLHWLYARSIWQQANGGLKAPLRDRGAGAHWSFLRAPTRICSCGFLCLLSIHRGRATARPACAFW